jgi:hypothetical protein
MAGLGLFDPQNALAVRRGNPRHHRIQILHWAQKKWAPESLTDKG